MKDSLVSILSRCYAALDRRHQLLVLTFHRVGGRSKIRTDVVERHLQFIATHYKVILPSELHAVSRDRRITIVTIDDCHEDVYKIIFPIAKGLGIPITICVPTDFFFRNRWLWVDKMRWGLAQAELGTEIRVGTQRIVVGCEETTRPFLEDLKHKEPSERDSAIDTLLFELGVQVPESPVEGFRPVKKTDMKKMLASELVEICAHTVTHPILTVIPDDEMRWEVTQSKEELEEFCGREIVSFCYPNGNPGDFSQQTKQALHEVGYRIAFTSVEGLNRPPEMDLLELNRICAHPRYSVFLKLASGLGELQQKFSKWRALGV